MKQIKKDIVRKRNEENRGSKQNERIQKRENMVEYINLYRFFD